MDNKWFTNMQEYFWRLVVVLDKLFKQIVFFNFISLPSRTLSGAEWSLTSFVWPINRTLWVTCNPQFNYPARQCPVTRSQETKAMNMIVKVPFWTVMVEHNQGSKFKHLCNRQIWLNRTSRTPSSSEFSYHISIKLKLYTAHG